MHANISEPYNQPGTAPDAPTVLQLLRTSVLVPPSAAPYNLAHNSSYNPSMGQQQIVDRLLKQKVCIPQPVQGTVANRQQAAQAEGLYPTNLSGWSYILIRLEQQVLRFVG